MGEGRGKGVFIWMVCMYERDRGKVEMGKR